jgi:hypothetical protein
MTLSDYHLFADNIQLYLSSQDISSHQNLGMLKKNSTKAKEITHSFYYLRKRSASISIYIEIDAEVTKMQRN